MIFDLSVRGKAGRVVRFWGTWWDVVYVSGAVADCFTNCPGHFVITIEVTSGPIRIGDFFVGF